jgi:hypothetical protein
MNRSLQSLLSLLDGMYYMCLGLASKRAWVSWDGLVGDFDFVLLIFTSMYTERKTGQ